MRMTLALFLSNKAEERIEALPVPPPAQLTTRSFAADAFHGACFLELYTRFGLPLTISGERDEPNGFN